jgi:hypothetical protein
MATAPGTPVRHDGWRPHPRRSEPNPVEAGSAVEIRQADHE